MYIIVIYYNIVFRYYAIIHPMKARYICTISQTKMIICFVWILSFILGTPTLYVQVHMHMHTHIMYNMEWKSNNKIVYKTICSYFFRHIYALALTKNIFGVLKIGIIHLYGNCMNCIYYFLF